MFLQNKKTTIMGILNVTPDSFSDGGDFFDIEKALVHAKNMIANGADIIDVGGESTRPGSDPVSVEEELRRVIPVIEGLKAGKKIIISIDTCKPTVARECLERGATIVNDVTGLKNQEMVDVIAPYKPTVVIMHMQGKPKNMQENPTYTDVIEDIYTFFEDHIRVAHAAGITDIILDPGIGFGKKLEHNLEILRRLKEFQSLDCPILVGTSRKSFLGYITGRTVNDRLYSSIGSTVAATMNGATMVRVHDVQETRDALRIVDEIIYP